MALDTLDKQAVQDLLRNTKNTAENQQLISRLNQLLNAKSILKDHFTYTANFLAMCRFKLMLIS